MGTADVDGLAGCGFPAVKRLAAMAKEVILISKTPFDHLTAFITANSKSLPKG